MSSSSAVIYEFTFDDSPTGRVKIAAASSAPVKEYDVQTYKAKNGGTAVSGQFVKFYASGVTYGLYMKLDDYKLRVAGDQATYKADWTQTESSGKLSCDVWDDDGRLVSQGGIVTRGIPSSLIARKGRGDTASDARRLSVQTNIWQTVAQDQASATRSGRLWKSRVPISPPLELVVVPNKQFITKDELQKCLADINMTDLSSWLKITVADSGSNRRCISEHLLGVYASYMSDADIKRLIAAQTDGRQVEKDWTRAFVTTAQAEAFTKAMVDSGKYKAKAKIQQTTTALTGARPKEERVDTLSIMGQSANVWGKTLWPKDTTDGTAAEWLHRSAYSFGPMTNADWQSQANLVFGTFEANGNMTRAESVIDGAIASITSIFEDTGKGKLNTKIINKGDYSVLGATGLEKIAIPAWVADSNHSYTWLSPELQYWGGFTATHSKLTPPVNYPFKTAFHTFNCYTPLTVEGQLDRRAWRTYFEKKFKYLRSKKRKAESDASTSGTSRPKRSLDAGIGIDIDPKVGLGVSIDTPLGGISVGNIPDYFDIPVNRDAWVAASNEEPVFQLGDTEVRNPTVTETSDSRPKRSILPASPPKGGYAMGGDIDLFGLPELKSTFESWQGPPPPEIEPGDQPPIFQKATIADLPIATIIPWLKGTPLEKAHLSNVTVVNQNYDFIPMKPIGWSISADLVVDDQFGSMNQILSKVLQIPPSSLTFQVMASLGLNQSWASLPHLSNFVLQGLTYVKGTGTEEYQTIRLCDGISLSHIGIRVFGVNTTVLGSSGQTTSSYGFSLLGQLDLEVPASKKPLEFDFEISEFGGIAEINAMLKGHIWDNALGLGFNLETVTFSSSFDISSPLKTLDLSVSAVLDAQPTVATLIGTYSVGGAITLSADIRNFTVNSIVDLYDKFSGEEVVLPEEFSVGDASITISSSNGLSIAVQDVKYGGYTATTAALHFGSDGVSLKGEMQDIDRPDLGVKLVDVVVNASLMKYGSAKSSSVELDVVVQLDDVQGLPKIAGTVHVYKEPQDKGLQWTVYGEFDGLGKSASLGAVFPEIKGTFLADVVVDDLAVIVASKDEPALSTMNPLKYPIKRGKSIDLYLQTHIDLILCTGFQICAVISSIKQITEILGHAAPGLILSAAWSKTGGFVLDIDLPADGIIQFGRGIKTDPIELEIDLQPVRLMIDAGLKVPVPKSPDPLDFKVGLTIQNEELSAFGQMSGYWVDPFGISPRVSIGPNLALQFTLNLLQFGTPEGFGFVGGLSIGDVSGQVAVEIEENPTQELIKGDIEHLGIQDLVAFTSDVINFDLPKPPNFIDFEKVSLYISTGVRIGTLSYPPGFSFEADIKIFDTEFTASAQITKDTFVVKGAIHNLTVGPLSVTGSKGGDAKFDLEVGASKQHVLVDGAIHILDSEVALLLELEILPTPKFYFDLELHLTSLLTFAVSAEMKGAADLHHLENLEFVLHALMEQHIIEYVVKQVNDSLEAAKEAADKGIESAELKVSKAKADMNKAIDKAQADVDEAYVAWKDYEKKVHKDSRKVIDDYKTTLTGYEGDLEKTRKRWDEKFVYAERKVREANVDRGAKMQAAEADVVKARKAWDDDIREKEVALEKAKEDLDRAFEKVDSLQHQIDDINHVIQQYKDAPGYEIWKKLAIPGLYIAVGAVEASKYVAIGVLEACKGVLEAADYLAKEGAVQSAEDALELVRTGGDGLLIAAQKTLEEVDKDTQAIMEDAAKLLEGVRVDGDAAIKAAEKVIEDFKVASADGLEAARDAVLKLADSVEWAEYQAATATLKGVKHVGSAAVDVANSALEAAKNAGDGVLEIAEDFFTTLEQAFNITSIEITADLAPFAGNFSFDAIIKGIIVGQQFTLELKLDLRDVYAFIRAIFLEVVGLAPKK
ncbi:hypothetical protein VNI00_006328 [Paramarasmius palmivorus]|uniref:Uncharacterized protein n=1 Tax=Paramarasmius palmivorus TaxID=297713 RepID=A0AAW0D8S4_9AGAR